MPISSKDAAAVAKKHGLTLGDAAALARLADTADEADELAGQFAPQKTPDQLADDVYSRIR